MREEVNICLLTWKKRVGYVRLVLRLQLAILQYLSVYTVFIHDIIGIRARDFYALLSFFLFPSHWCCGNSSVL